MFIHSIPNQTKVNIKVIPDTLIINHLKQFSKTYIFKECFTKQFNCKTCYINVYLMNNNKAMLMSNNKGTFYGNKVMKTDEESIKSFVCMGILLVKEF